MKLYKDKEGCISIVFSKDESTAVTLIHDRGVEITKHENLFGNKPSRFIYHCANAHGDSGYSSGADKWTKEELGQEYKIIRKKAA